MLLNLSIHYVPQDIAILLQEIGFNESCAYVYRLADNEFMAVENIPNWEDFQGALNEQLPDGYVSAPALELAREWIEEVYHLFINVECGYDLDDLYHWTGVVWYDFNILPIRKDDIIIPESDSLITFDKSWKAAEAGVRKCVKIIKSRNK